VPVFPLKASSVVDVEQSAAEEPSGHRIVAWVVRHRNSTYDRPIQAVDQTAVCSTAVADVHRL